MKDTRVEEWLTAARGAAEEALLAASGPRGMVVACSEAAPAAHGLHCPRSPWRPAGVLAYATVAESTGAPVYTGFIWIEASGGGVDLACLDLAAAEPRPPLRVYIHGYASPEELARGVGLEELGAAWLAPHVCRGNAEAAARLMAEAVGVLLLRRSALPAPPSFAPDLGPWLRVADGVYEADPLVLYVSPSWAPNAGYTPGMAVPPAGIYVVEPGPRLLVSSREPCVAELRL